MNTLNMAQHGVFGEVVRAQGAYIHNLDQFWDYYWKNGENDKLGWRLDYNMRHRGDVYATHGLGPVAQALNIHRGDRMKTLVAMDTKSVVGKALVEARTDSTCNNFRNGDHTTTLIRTENGKVIEIQHNVMTPQPYNRLYQLTGTKGFANKYPVEGYAVEADQLSASGVQPKVDDLSAHSFLPEAEMKALVEKYQHPILKNMAKWRKKWAVMAVWTSLWTAVLFTACRTDFLWIWMFMTWQNGAAWLNWASFRWTTVVLRSLSPTSHAANGMW